MFRVFALIVCSVALAAQQTTNPLSGVEQDIERAMKAFSTPGVAVAVVQDDRVVFSRGFGVRKLGTEDKVDTQTLFAIASCTKAFTAAALAMLVDEKRISWDDRVVDHVPAFQLYDPYVSREVRVRDLLTHRTGLGLGAGDLMIFPPTDMTTDEIFSRLRYIKPVTGLRYRAAYNNLMFVAAGKVIEAVSGQKWGEFTESRIFTPVGMKRSNTSMAVMRREPNAAFPHALEDGVMRAQAYEPFDNAAAAAGIHSNVEDMVRWLQLQLAGGVIPGSEKTLFSKAAAREMHGAQFALPVTDPPTHMEPMKTNFSAWALGWAIGEYRGYKYVRHDGGLTGFRARVMMIPEKKIGFVILENGPTNIHAPLGYMLLDRLLGITPGFDWVKAYQTSLAHAEERYAKQTPSKPAGPVKPGMTIASYAGTYRDEWRGDVFVTEEQGKLRMRFSRTSMLEGDLEHWQHDTFIVRWRDRALDADAFVTFSFNPDGSVHDVRMRPVSPRTDFSYDFHDLLLTPVKNSK